MIINAVAVWNPVQISIIAKSSLPAPQSQPFARRRASFDRESAGSIRYDATVRAGHLIPARNGEPGWRLHKGVGQHAAVKIFANGQTEQGQDGWGDVQQTDTVDQLILFNAGAVKHKNAMGTMFGSRTGR